MLNLTEPHILSITPYVAGKAIDENSNIPFWAKLGSNENCLGPPPKAIEAALLAMKKTHLYPNADVDKLIRTICILYKDFNLKPENIALGSGSSELIINLVRGFLGTNECMLNSWPSFMMYRVAAKTHGREEITLPLTESMDYDLEKILKTVTNNHEKKIKLIFIANPNNPTGKYISKDIFDRFIKELSSDVVLVIDEAYFEYVTKKDYPNGIHYALSRPRTVVLRTFSKVYGLAGLRVGYAMGDKKIIDVLARVSDPFHVNSIAQVAAIEALKNVDHVTQSIKHNDVTKPVLIKNLRDVGFFVGPCEGNFVLAKRNEFMPTINEMCQKLFEQGVIIRSLDNYGLDDHVRVSVGTKEQIQKLSTEICKVI